MPFLSARQQSDPGSAQKPTGKGAEHSDASNNFFLARNAESPAPQEGPVEEAAPTATSPSKKGKRGAQAKTTPVAEEQGQQAPAVASEPPARRQSARNAAAAATTQATRTEQAPDSVSPKKTRAAAINKSKEPAPTTAPATRKQKSAAQAKVAQELTDAQQPEATSEDGMAPIESLLYNQDMTESFVADDTQPKANPADDGKDTIQPPLAQLAKQLRKSKAGGKRKRKVGRNTVTATDAASASDESDGHAADPDAIIDADEGADEDEEQEIEKPAKAPRQRGPAKPRVDADGFPLKRAKRTQNGKELRQIARKGFGKQRPLVKQDGTPAVVGTPKHKKIEATCFECREAQTSNFRPIVSDYVGKKSKATEKITRVEVCNRCYCKMAPRPDYLPWRLNLLRLQIEIFGQAGITQFHCFRFSDDGIKTLAEALEYVDFVRDSLAGGSIVGGLKVKPVLPGQVTPMRRPSPDMRPMQLQPLQPMPQMQQMQQMQPMHQMQQMQPMQSYGVHDGLQAMRGGAHMPQLIHHQGPGETESEIALRQLNQHAHVPVPIPEPILEM